MRHFAMYWKPSTVETARGGDDSLRYAASNQLDRVAVGDTIWLLTAPSGRLTLVGRINVGALVDRATAIERLGTLDLWAAERYALPPVGDEPERIVNLDLSAHAAELRFITTDGDACLSIDQGGAVNAQQLQTMRVLTEASAMLLAEVWGTRGRSLARVCDSAAISANVHEFNATAGENHDRALSLFSLTEYWVFDPSTGDFGPGKFVGYETMSFDLYEAAHRDEVTGVPFDGHVTRKAIEAVLGDFVEDLSLVARLDEWARARLAEHLPEVDRTKWRFVQLGVAGKNALIRPKKERVNDQMYDCEARLLFVENGSKVWRWERRAVKVIGDDRDVRCMHCRGAVRIHRQKVPHGPADHVEHLRRRDSEHCRGGHHFKGEHRVSDEPVA